MQPDRSPIIYALVIDQTITATGQPPRGARRLDDGSWVTPPADGWTDELAAACGWLPVVDTPRPADTATDTHESTYTVDGATVVQSWTPRPWTADELAARAETAARLDDHEERLRRIEAVLWPAPTLPDDPADPSVPDWAALGGIWPDGGLLRDGGALWRNVAGVPLTTPPSRFPGTVDQWTHLFVRLATIPDPVTPAPDRPAGYIGPWDAATSYAVGDVCDRAERYYRAKIAHGAAYGGTWGPPLASVWDDIGPAT